MKIEHASWSGLKNFAKSPKHYLNYLEEKTEGKTDAMIRGILTHCLVLEPKELEKKFNLHVEMVYLPVNQPI